MCILMSLQCQYNQIFRWYLAHHIILTLSTAMNINILLATCVCAFVLVPQRCSLTKWQIVYLYVQNKRIRLPHCISYRWPNRENLYRQTFEPLSFPGSIHLSHIMDRIVHQMYTLAATPKLACVVCRVAKYNMRLSPKAFIQFRNQVYVFPFCAYTECPWHTYRDCKLYMKRKRSTHMRTKKPKKKKNPFSATRFFARFVSFLFSILLDLKWVARAMHKRKNKKK